MNLLLAMTHVGYVAAGWIITFVVLGGYGALLVRRGRTLSDVVPPEERRWS